MDIQIGDFKIRDFVPQDRHALVEYGDNPNVAANLRDRFPSPYTLAAADEWIALVTSRERPTHFAIANANEVIGGIGLELRGDVYRHSAEIGYWLGEPLWGRGIATRAVRALTEWAMDELDLVRIYAAVFEVNTASVRVLEKAGYAFEARLRKSVIKNGRFMDELVYARIRE